MKKQLYQVTAGVRLQKSPRDCSCHTCGFTNVGYLVGYLVAIIRVSYSIWGSISGSTIIVNPHMGLDLDEMGETA